MAKYLDINSNVQFENIKFPSFVTSGRIARGPYTIDDQNNIIGTYGPVINAIDIDWNKVLIESTGEYINTTGDLIKQINYIYTLLDNLDLGDDYLKAEDLTTELLSSKLNSTYAAKAIEDTVNSLESELSNKANISDIPTSIDQLNDINKYATKSWTNELLGSYATRIWVNQQLSTYQKSAYQIAQEHGFTGTETEWLESLRGENGINGDSAYELAKKYNAYIGTEEEWIASLKGEKGERGEKGDTGASINILGYYETLEELKEATADTINSIGDAYNVGGTFYVYNDEFNGDINEKWKSAGAIQGDPGKSAYELAVLHGYEGTEGEWINSLTGQKGDKGDKGDTGNDGLPGKSAWEIYRDLKIKQGESYLEEDDWINSLSNGGSQSTQYYAGSGISIDSNNIISVSESAFWGILAE